MQDFTSLFTAKQRILPFGISIPSTLNFARLNPIPHKYRPGRRRMARLRTHFPRPDDVTRLQTSFNPLDTVRALRRHRWVLLDLQYVFLAAIALISLSLAPPAPLIKTFSVMGGVLLFLMPITRQFFWPGAAIWVYLIYFFCSR